MSKDNCITREVYGHSRDQALSEANILAVQGWKLDGLFKRADGVWFAKMYLEVT